MNISDDICSKKEELLVSENECIENKKEFVIHTTKSSSLFSNNTEITEVIPHLLMGSIDPALDHDLLKEREIRHVLTLGLLNVPNFEGISYHHMRLVDQPRFNILPHLETAISVIDSARKANENIYVHCQAGISRSSTVVIAYLMGLNAWTYQQAYEYLKDLRPCIEPNAGFAKQLLKYEINIMNK